MGIIGDDFADFVEGKVAFVSCDVKIGKLNFGAGIGVIFGDLFPDSDSGFRLVESGHGFGKRHK